jgi:hypothetical protein
MTTNDFVYNSTPGEKIFYAKYHGKMKKRIRVLA